MNLEARPCAAPSGFLDFSVAACDHSAADMPAGGCSRTATECVIPLHPRATVLTDLRDQAVRLMKRRGQSPARAMAESDLAEVATGSIEPAN